MPETQHPVLTGYYDTDRNALWTLCRHCRTWACHTAPGIPAGRHADACGRPTCRLDCPLRTSWYRIRVSQASLARPSASGSSSPRSGSGEFALLPGPRPTCTVWFNTGQTAWGTCWPAPRHPHPDPATSPQPSATGKAALSSPGHGSSNTPSPASTRSPHTSPAATGPCEPPKPAESP